MEDENNNAKPTTTIDSEEYVPPPLPSIHADDAIDDAILYPSDGEMDTHRRQRLRSRGAPTRG